YGPLAPHGAAFVGLYALFTGLAHAISFGRVERSPALVVAVTLIVLLFLAMIGLFVLTLWTALRDMSGRDLPDGRRQILFFTAGAGLCLLLLPRLFSKDVLSYLVYGQMHGAYGLNPYINNPNNVQFDYTFRLIDWHYEASVYGPVWTLLCTGLYKLAAPLATTHIWGYIVAFRAVGLLLHLANVALIWSILGRLRPRQQVAGTIFYAWNPLALIEFPGNGHNDVALVFFLLAAIAAHLRGRPALVALCLALSVLTKFITVLVVPAYLLLLWRNEATVRARLSAWARAGAVGLAAFALLWAPFYEVWRDPLFLLRSSAASRYDNSLLEIAYWGLRHLFAVVLPRETGDEIANTLIKTAGRVAFLAIWAWLTWRVRDTEGWIRASFWILFAYLVVGTAWFWPWYVTWLVGLAPLVGGRRATAATLTFSASVLVIYVLWGNQLPFDRGSLYPLHNIVAFGLPLLALWLQLRRGGPPGEPVYAPAASGDDKGRGARGHGRGAWGVRA
ncbi:MAG: hypothetical protein M3Q65_16035, partial [Chloroflexota bacterium]|nr:hypothetical protein [Chloroflexota bacterium]